MELLTPLLIKLIVVELDQAPEPVSPNEYLDLTFKMRLRRTESADKVAITNFQSFIESKCSQLGDALSNLKEPSQLLTTFVEKWEQFHRAVLMVSHIMKKLTEKCQVESDFFVETFCDAWRDFVIIPLNHLLLPIILNAIDADREKNPFVSSDIINKVFAIYSSLTQKDSRKTDICIVFLFAHVVKTTESFYRSETVKFLDDVEKYLNQYEMRLQEETRRKNSFFIFENGSYLCAFDSVWINAQRDFLENAFIEHMFRTDESSLRILRKLYNILSDLETKEPVTVIKTFKQLVSSRFIDSIVPLLSQKDKFAQQIIPHWLNTFQSHRAFLNQIASEETMIGKRLIQSATSALCRSLSRLSVSFPRFPLSDKFPLSEIVSYIDFHIQLENANIDELSLLVRVLPEKDSFFSLMQNSFIRRFLSLRCILKNEKAFIEKNSDFRGSDCFCSYEERLREIIANQKHLDVFKSQRMITYSKEFSAYFLNSKAWNSANFTFYKRPETTQKEKSSPKGLSFLPLPFRDIFEEYSLQFHLSNPFRSIRVIPEMGYALITLTIDKLQINCSVSLPQLGVLLLFLEKSSYSLSEISCLLCCSPSEAAYYVETLINHKIIKFESEKRVYSIQSNLANGPREIVCASLISSDETPENQTNFSLKSKRDRINILKGFIVKTFKKDKCKSYNSMFKEAEAFTQKWFSLSPDLFKEVMELLIELEFIERSLGNFENFAYIVN